MKLTTLTLLLILENKLIISILLCVSVSVKDENKQLPRNKQTNRETGVSLETNHKYSVP